MKTWFIILMFAITAVIPVLDMYYGRINNWTVIHAFFAGFWLCAAFSNPVVVVQKQLIDLLKEKLRLSTNQIWKVE